MFDFSKPIYENKGDIPFICAHRGVSGGNIPCNSLAAFSAAINHGADIIELDITKSRDGEFFIFHPGMESAHLNSKKLISLMKASNVDRFRYVNQDNTKTQFPIAKAEEVFTFLRGKCYINVDKFWTDIPGITDLIRRCGVEKQVIVKTPVKDKYLEKIKEISPDFMFMPIVEKKDDITDKLVSDGINCIGAEVLFTSENDEVATDAYITEMHKKGRLLFANAIVYDYKSVLSAGHTDDISVSESPDKGWGWLAQKGFDIIQTDWCLALKNYLYDGNSAQIGK